MPFFFKNQYVKVQGHRSQLIQRSSDNPDQWVVGFRQNPEGTHYENILILDESELQPWTEEDDRKAKAAAIADQQYAKHLQERETWTVHAFRILDKRQIPPPRHYTGTVEQWRQLPIIPDICLVLADNPYEATALARKDLFLNDAEELELVTANMGESMKNALLSMIDAMRCFDLGTDHHWRKDRIPRTFTLDH